MKVYVISDEPISSYDLSKCFFYIIEKSDDIMYCSILNNTSDDSSDNETTYNPKCVDSDMKDSIINGLYSSKEEIFTFRLSLLRINACYYNSDDEKQIGDMVKSDTIAKYSIEIDNHRPIRYYINKTIKENSDSDTIQTIYFNADISSEIDTIYTGSRQKCITTIKGYGYLYEINV